MARAFHRLPDGRIGASFEDDECRFLIGLIDDFLTLLDPGPSSDPLGLGIMPAAERSSDDVLARLLPDAHADDPEAAAEFRRLTEHDLRRHKVAALTDVRSLLGASGDLVLDEQTARTWMTGLNDLRLAVGTRMGLGLDDGVTPVPALEPLYDWLTWLQGGLIDAVTGDADTLAT